MTIPMIMKDPPVSETIKAVINTLNSVTVSGRDNMDRLLGSIIALEKVLARLEEQKSTAEAKPDKD